jgi:hypothetical protein
MRYCTQCTDVASETVGCFGYDELRYWAAKEGGKVEFFAITPVFPSLYEMFAWMREKGIVPDHSIL